jgi:hypothetical protein
MMTPDEKARQMKNRNDAICAYYSEGHSLPETASKFRLGRQRTQQILEVGGVWRPYTKSPRSEFLGVMIAPETKAAIRDAAQQLGLSASEVADSVLGKALVKE